MTPTPPDPAQTPQPMQPVSPTGSPLMSARLAPYLFAATTLCTLVAGASQMDLGLPKQVFGWALIGAAFFGAMLGATPGLRKTVPLVLLMLGVGLSSCSAHQQPLVITSDTMVAAGKTFEGTAAVMNSLHATHAMSEAQYRTWYDFALRYKASFHAARLLYDSATAGGDQSTQQIAANIVAGFIAELGTFEALIQQIGHPDGGAT